MKMREAIRVVAVPAVHSRRPMAGVSSAVAAVLPLVLQLVPGTCLARSWTLGSHVAFGIMRSSVEGSGTSTVLGAPANALAYQPGLRLALGDSARSRELGFDVGLLFIDEAGSSFTVLTTLFSYQQCFARLKRTSPFANISLGVLREGGAARSTYSAAAGAGFGLRRIVGDRHGALRAEARVDVNHRDPDRDRPTLTTVGLRLGFDLWL